MKNTKVNMRNIIGEIVQFKSRSGTNKKGQYYSNLAISLKYDNEEVNWHNFLFPSHQAMSDYKNKIPEGSRILFEEKYESGHWNYVPNTLKVLRLGTIVHDQEMKEKIMLEIYKTCIINFKDIHMDENAREAITTKTIETYNLYMQKIRPKMVKE